LLVVGPGTPIIAPGVEYLGPLDATRRDQLLRKAAMLVAPHTGQESFGLVLVEALACDTPVVASDLVEFRTTLSDDTGTVAVLVPPENAPALAAAIIDTFQRPPDTERGRAVAARYSWDSIGPQILALYQQAIS
jgi:phosphatidylinositol alpha-mannosyltransferase